MGKNDVVSHPAEYLHFQFSARRRLGNHQRPDVWSAATKLVGPIDAVYEKRRRKRFRLGGVRGDHSRLKHPFHGKPVAGIENMTKPLPPRFKTLLSDPTRRKSGVLE